MPPHAAQAGAVLQWVLDFLAFVAGTVFSPHCQGRPAMIKPSTRLPFNAPRVARPWPVLALAVLAACASTPPPKSELAVAEAAVANASSAGALQFAPAELRSAQDKLVRAQAAMAAKEHAQALTLAMEASADAQLAAAATRAAKAQRAADEVQEGNRVLREEMARKQATPPIRTP